MQEEHFRYSLNHIFFFSSVKIFLETCFLQLHLTNAKEMSLNSRC